MGFLYGKDGSIKAYYENGIVYDDATKRRILGTYKNGYVYESDFFGGNCVGKYERGCIFLGIGSITATGVGSIRGNSVYYGTNSLNTSRIAYFTGDGYGAAAAALLVDIFEESKVNFNNMTDNNGEYFYTEIGKIDFSNFFGWAIFIVLIFSSAFDIIMIKELSAKSIPAIVAGVSMLVGLIASLISNICMFKKNFKYSFGMTLTLSVIIAVSIYVVYFYIHDISQIEGYSIILIPILFSFMLFIPNLIVTGIVYFIAYLLK